MLRFFATALAILFLATARRAQEAEEEPRFRTQWDFWLREEPNYAQSRKDSLLNPDDILGMPRWQNRVLASADAKVPLIGGSGINPVLELVFADTFVYLQHEGNHPTLAKPLLQDFRNFVKELYFNLRPTQNWLLSIGRRNLIDGVGYSRNPVDFMANPSALPGANFDNRFRLRNREGSWLVRAEYLWKNGGTSFMYAPALAPSTAENARLRSEIDRLTQFNRTEAYWAKVHQLVLGYDLALHYFYRERHHLGFALTKVFGEALELHAEARAQRGSAVLLPRQRSEDIYFGNTLLQPALYDFTQRSEQSWFARVLLGGQYTFENKLNLAVEYYYHGEGYSAAERNTFYQGLELANGRFRESSFLLPAGNPYQLFLLAANLHYSFLSFGQHYAFSRLADPEFLGLRRWEAAVFALVHVADGSGIASGELVWHFNDYLDLQLLANVFYGSRRSESGLFYQAFSILVGIDAQF